MTKSNKMHLEGSVLESNKSCSVFRDKAKDSEAIYTKIMDVVCGEHNKKFSWDIKVKMMGQKETAAGKILIDELGLPITVEEYVSKVGELLRKLMPEVPLLPGADKLVRHLHKHKIPMAIATGSDRNGYDSKTSRHKEFFGLFDPVVLSSEDPEVKHGKPAPDCFLVAARRFPDNPEPAKCLVFEDAPNGAQAGIAAGMPVVWVPDHNVNRAPLQDKVSLLLDTLEDFKPETFGLPPYDT